MRFVSTRGQTPPHRFLEAVEAGLAPDGGLFIPETLPSLAPHLAAWEGLDYASLAAAFFGLFADDLSSEELQRSTREAYARFQHKDVAPLVRLDGDGRLQVLELFHGPTLAFKDFALQLLGGFYKDIVRRTGRPFNVLGATSGDTGSAAIHGCMGQPGIRIVILYPDGRVAPLQERQMACTGADNVVAVPIPGTFDDAQRLVKETFGDTAFAREHRLAAVNSINISRVLAQCVYYVWAWLRTPRALREQGVHFVVPTGNFGNVLAGWLAARMGLPGCTFTVATNRNDILHRFFAAGDYSVSEVAPSLAPSMDIQLASNFERFLHYAQGQDPARTREAMAELKARGALTLADGSVRAHFRSSRLDDAGISAVIKAVHERYGYLVCPHTACGFAELTSGTVPVKAGSTIVLATAHPAKFPEAVEAATGVHPKHSTLEALKNLPLRRTPLPADLGALKALLAR